jgi:hypothetical protein
MCASLAGDAARASTLIGQARRRSGLSPIDITLAEKVVGAGANTRRAVTVQWDDVPSLNSWRFGIAAATGMEIPARLMQGAGAHVRAWGARAPMVPLEQRVDAAQTAASLGVFSNASLVEMYSLIADGTDASELRERWAAVFAQPMSRATSGRGWRRCAVSGRTAATTPSFATPG